MGVSVSKLEEEVQSHARPMTLLRQGELSVQGRVLRSDDVEFSLEDESLEKVASHVGIPKNYLTKLPDDLVEKNLGYFLGINPEKRFVVEYSQNGESGDDGRPSILTIYDEKDKLVKREEYLELVTSVLPSDTEIVNYNFSEGKFFIDAATPQAFTEPREGDITRGGIRLNAHINVSKNRPTISSFLYRLACENGMVVTDQQGYVRIRGNTVDEILEEMDSTANRMFGDVNTHLNQWNHLSEVEVDNVDRLVHRFSTEVGLSAALERRLMEGAPSIQDRTMYGVINYMTEFQNFEGVNSVQVDRLQTIPSNVIGTGQVHRCPECSHLLTE